MSRLEKAVSSSGNLAFTMKYRPDFPIEFLCGENRFSEEETALLGDIIHPDDYQPFCEMVGEIISGQSREIKAHVRLRSDEVYRWYYISAAPDFRGDGSLAELCGMMFDVTEYLDCEGEDAVMRSFRKRVKASMDAAGNAPRLLDILGLDYLERIQQPFSHIKGLYSLIVGTDGKPIAAPCGQDKKLNLNKMSYQRKKNIRIKHQAVATWIIAGESLEDVNESASLLETMVRTVAEIANSYVVICEEMENSQKANKLLGENFEDQILVNNIYSLILQSKHTSSSFSSIIPLIKEYFELDDLIFCADSMRPVKVYRWDENGALTPIVTSSPGSESVDRELEFNAVVCVDEDELRGNKSQNRSCALSRIYENGETKGVLVFISKKSGRVWSNRDRKVLKNVTQIVSTVIYRSFMENELAVSQEHLLRLAYFNTTTGIPNRSAFERDFRKHMENGVAGAVISIEIANLKEMSETYSIRYADDIVRSIAEYIAAVPAGSAKKVYLFSNDVLLVTLENASRKDACNIAQTILAKFRTPWFLNEVENKLDIYAGICVFPEDADDVADCVRVSTKTLRLAKDRRLHDVVCYSDGLEEKLDGNLRIKKLIMDAADNDFQGFYFLYTPVVDARTGELQCCDAHLFWGNGELIVPRDRYLPIVDRMGLSIEIYDFVINRICEFCAAVRESGLSDFRVGFGIPEGILNSDESIMVLQKGLLEYSLPPEAISISISESDGTLNSQNVNLKQLWNIGVNIICDDKGGNFLTTAPLENPYVKMIKLRSRRLSDDPVSAAFIRSMIASAHEKGLPVCIKGVDNAKSLDNARSFDADLIQGIINGRPLHTSEFIRKMVMNRAVK